MDHFEKACRENNLKITPQRVAIYKALLNNAEHPTADSIYRNVKTKFPSISFDTVNRTLISFAHIGLIGTVECSGQGKKYDPNTVPHHHMKCMDCGAIIDFFHKAFDTLKVPGRISKQFKIMNKRVVLTGICQTCIRKGGT